MPPLSPYILSAKVPIVNPDGTPTVQFLAYLTAVQNGMPVVESLSDLNTINPVRGWQRFVSSLGFVATANGSEWLDPAGTAL